MSRELFAGSRLNEIAGSLTRWPAWQILVWNPNKTTINEVAAGTVRQAPFDLTPYVAEFEHEENIGFENGNDPSVTRVTFRFKRSPAGGKDMRRGLVEDGVIVRVLVGDRRVRKEDWVPLFTGTFRGRPGDDRGTPARLTEGLEATAYGREERYLNLDVTTEVFGKNTDVGQIALAIATGVMELGQDEVRFGAQGFRSQHVSNQIVSTNCLDALWQLFFTVGKKPKFDAQGRLVAVDVNLDKPAARIFSRGDVTVEQSIAAPNDLEVNNEVELHGLSATLTKAVQAMQFLFSVDVVTGFFDSSYDRVFFYSDDRSQRAQNTFLHEKHKISWSDATWTEIDEFSGALSIDTHYLATAREIIFGVYLALELAVAFLDFLAQQSNGVLGDFLATLRQVLKVAALVALAALLWAMNFIGRGTYEVWGEPFEFVYQELVSKAKLPSLRPEEIRSLVYRNDLLSSMDDLDAISREHLRRELVKNQLFTITLMDDPLLEVDDVIELSSGERFYVNAVRRVVRFGEKSTVDLLCWKIFDPVTAALETEAVA